MGVSYNFTVGYGFEVSEKRLRKVANVDPEGEEYDDDAWEALDGIIRKEYPLLGYAWAGDAYSGYSEQGYIVVVKRLSHTVKGWGVEKANLSPHVATEEESKQLYAAFDSFGRRVNGIGYFTASSVG